MHLYDHIVSAMWFFMDVELDGKHAYFVFQKALRLKFKLHILMCIF